MKDRSLPHQPVPGDRVKLKAERITAYQRASKLAGYEFDAYAIREVTRVDPWASGGGSRLHVEGPPHMFRPSDVALAWNTEDERKEMLKARGYTYDKKADKWLAP